MVYKDLHISDFFIMGVRCFDKDTPTNKSETIQKTIKKGRSFSFFLSIKSLLSKHKPWRDSLPFLVRIVGNVVYVVTLAVSVAVK